MAGSTSARAGGPAVRAAQPAQAAPAAQAEEAAALVTELTELIQPRILEVNLRHGDAHGVNLTALRAIAKRVKANQPLALELWDTGDPNARLLALLLARPKEFAPEQLDAMLREAGSPKAHDWLINYVVKKGKHTESLREAWMIDADPVVRSAGWALTTERVGKNPDGLDLPGLLDTIEAEMKDAEQRLQWAMNETLANIGIFHAELRGRALEIGKRLEVLKDYPTPPGCTSPFAPEWINEMVRRREGVPTT